MDTILSILRDPVWQFVGVVVAVIALIVTWARSSPLQRRLKNVAIVFCLVLIIFALGAVVINVNKPPPLVVSGKSQDGAVFIAPENGKYQVMITDGAYNTNSCDDRGHWRTVLRIYINRPSEWGKLQPGGNIEPVQFDDSIGAGAFSDTQQDAVVEAMKPENSTRTFNLQKGDRLLFVPADVQNGYEDNCGNVDLSITVIQS